MRLSHLRAIRDGAGGALSTTERDTHSSITFNLAGIVGAWLAAAVPRLVGLYGSRETAREDLDR